MITLEALKTLQYKTAIQKTRFKALNNRNLTYIEKSGLKKLSNQTSLCLEETIRLYTEFSQNSIPDLIFLTPHIMNRFFLLWNYGKYEAVKLLKERVISESGMDDVIELAEQMKVYLGIPTQKIGFGGVSIKEAAKALSKLGKVFCKALS